MEKTKNFLSDNVLRIRSKLGLTQSEIAERADITLSGYQCIEYGTRKGRAETISKIAKALGVTVEDLYRDPNEKIEEMRPIDQAFMLTEAQLKALSEDAAVKGAKAALDAINKPTVSKQDTKNLSEKDKLILEITSGLPLLEINKLKVIRDRVLRGNSVAKIKKPVNF